MNTNGIAVATDSAMTISNQKVYNSSNKLFELSKRKSIGMMIYGDASFLNVPWETFIKVYGHQLSEQGFDTVNEYADDFLSFLTDNEYEQYMAPVNEEKFIKRMCTEKVNDIHRKLTSLSENLYSEYGELHLQDEVQARYMHHGGVLLTEMLQKVERKPYLKGFSEQDIELLSKDYETSIITSLENKFESLLFMDSWLGDMTQIILHSIVKEISSVYSGVVLVGYGNKEIYPSIVTCLVNGKVNGKIKYRVMESRTKKIDHERLATVIPFAQKDMVDSFLTGIHIKLDRFLDQTLKKELHALPTKIIEKVKDDLKAEVDLKEVETTLNDELKEVYKNYYVKMKRYQQSAFIDPILDTVTSLPTQELAHMAEALLNITSLDRKMSMSLETVGGPIDVAVITKGDGFTWVKKK